MRRRLEPALRRWWRGESGALGAALQTLAAPAEWAYRGAVALRNARHDRAGGFVVEGLRVVSVGNLALGGTGKTPVSAWAARALAAAGHHPALVSRGYGRDELLLHRRWNPDIPVVADSDRVAAARAARAGGARAVVVDDGFQHRRLARDTDLVLLAAEDPFPGRLLPRGPFREPVSALGRAHGVVVTRRVASEADARTLAEKVSGLFPGVVTGRLALLPGAWEDLDGARASPPRGPTLAVAALARPEAFAAQVEAATGEPTELVAFPDHHGFTLDDVKALRARAGERTVVVTEKDGVKLQPFAAPLGHNVRVLEQSLCWEAGEAEIARLVTDGKGP